MKILMITPYVTIESRPEFSRNKTGFGYMVMDIAKSIGGTDEVELLATDSRGEAFTSERVKFLKRSFGLFFSTMLFVLLPSAFTGLCKQYHMRRYGSYVRLFYYWLMTGYLSRVLHKGKYDVVHIHGCGFGTELWIQVCRRCGQKFVVTLHGLNSFSESVKLEPAGKQYERDFLRRVAEGKFPITVISTGMKRLIQNSYGVNDCPNIYVVCNSFNFKEDVSSQLLDNSVRKKHNIPEGAKVLVYVGNISRNKNQEQMVRAFALLPDELQLNTYVLFCGNENDLSVCLKERIEKSNLSGHLIMCGGVNRDEIPSYYQTADGVVLLSIAEGFGLSLIEGMYFGLPCAMPSDFDAFEDIFHQTACISIKDRSDETVASGIEKLLNNEWDKKVIKDYSRKFESAAMAEKYIEVYNNI